MQVEDIRTVMIDGEQWYVGSDFTKALGYKDTVCPLTLHVDDKDKQKYQISTSCGKRNAILVNKDGLESLLSSCQNRCAKIIAKKFNIRVKRQITKITKVEGIRIVIIDGEKWYVGSDVGMAIGYTNPKDVTGRYINDKNKKKSKIPTIKGKQNVILINKHGLEELISHSNMQNTRSVAKKFDIKINKKINIQNKKSNRNEDIRTVILDGEKWYVGIDVARALGYKSPSDYVKNHADDKDIKKYRGNRGNWLVINRHGLERLVSSSITPNTINIAKKLGIHLNHMLDTYKEENIRNIMIDGKLWFVAKDVATILGYTCTHGVTCNVNKKNKINRVIKGINGNYIMALINKQGIEQLISSSRMPNALDVADKFNINVNHMLNTRKEQDSIYAILKTFKGENMVTQYRVGTYRIDLYFPKYKLAIECDEFGHSNRDQEYEQTRQHYIEDKLGCKFIRYNPDSKDYNIFDILNKIHKEIIKQ